MSSKIESTLPRIDLTATVNTAANWMFEMSGHINDVMLVSTNKYI